MVNARNQRARAASLPCADRRAGRGRLWLLRAATNRTSAATHSSPSAKSMAVTDVAASFADALRDRYVLDGELGRGGMATVWLARDLKHGRPVALKVLHAGLAASLGADRFQREIQVAARLQHPHILTVLDSGEAAGRLWFTMPHVEGESLRARLRREGQLSVEEALHIARSVAAALDYAHAKGIIHRDIKPENILLYQGEPMVADFGISLAPPGPGQERLTETGLSLGTPAYMSPEQASASPNLDGRGDQYGLACVVYEMLAGEPPYTGPTAHAIVAKRLSDPVPSVRRLRPTVPEKVDRAVRRALATLPADRFSTTADFARALEVPASTPLSAVTVVTPSAGSAKRRRVPVAAIALGLGLVLGLGVLFAWRKSPVGAAAPTPRIAFPMAAGEQVGPGTGLFSMSASGLRSPEEHGNHRDPAPLHPDRPVACP
jgi:hypothetical protein